MSSTKTPPTPDDAIAFRRITVTAGVLAVVGAIAFGGYAGWRHGGGFLAGAMQTALGVAGGMLIADALMGAFDAGAAEAGELAQDAGLVEEPASEPAAHEEPAWDDGGMGGDDGFEI